MLFSTALKKSIASALVLVNLAYPITATAGQYMGLVSVKDLVVTNGELPPVVNIDTSNNSSGTFRAGSAVVKVAPGTIAFGITEAGKRTAEQTVTLSNIGGATAQLGTLSSDRQFSVSKNCDGVTLPPLGTCLVNIAYAPTQVTNLVTSTVLIPFSSGASSAQAVVHVSGSSTMPQGSGASVPAVSITEAPTAFGLALINQQSLSQTFNVRSTGSAALELKGIKILGDNESFKFSSSCDTAIAPGESCPVTVTFEPSTVGAKSAQIELDTNAFQKNIVTLPLTGDAIEVFPIYGAASTSSVDFGEATIAGAADVRRTVTIVNSGTAGLQTSFALSGSHTAGVSIANNTCQGGLAAGGSCTLELVLDASAARVALGQLVVTHDGKLTPTSPVSIPFSGEVLAQTRVLNYSPAVVFGNVDINTPAVQTVSITNHGNSPVTGVSATVAAPFSVTGSTCEGLSLVPGGGNSCKVTISLTHSTLGALNRAGSITATGLTSPAAPLTLSALLQQRTVSAVTPSALNFGLTSTLTWSDAQTVQVTNTGTVRVSPRVASRDPVTGQLTTSNWIRVATDTCTSGIEPGASCSFGIQVKPDSSNSASATVTVYPDEGMSTQGRTFSVTAQGNPQSYQASTGALDFGTVGSLQTVDRSITFTNTSAEGTSVTGFTQQIVQPVAGNITLTSNTCGGTLAPGANCTATYRFAAPSSTRVEAWAVTGGSVRAYFSGARASAEVFEANISLVGSAVTIANDGTDFGATPVGQAANTAPRKTATVTNTGAYPVRLAEIEFGENSLNLVVDTTAPSSCVSNTTLNAGQSCVVTTYPGVATYTGTSGAKSATLNIPAVDRSNPAKVLSPIEYTGTLTPVALSSEVAALDFGLVGENTQTVRTFTFTVSHGGSAHLTPTAVGTGYTVTSSCPTGWVAAGTVCTVSVQLRPGVQQGNLSGELTVFAATEGISKPVLSASLFAQVEPMSLSIVQSDLSFGSTPAQTPGIARYAVIQNTSSKGIATLSVGGVNPTGTLSLARSDSSVETYDYAGRTLKTCAIGTPSLNPGEMCYVKFVTTNAIGNSASVGTYSGAAQVTSNTSQGILSLALSANFLPADLALSVSSVTFETPTPSASAHAPDKAVTLTNTGLGRLWLAERYLTVSGDYYFVKADGGLTRNLLPAAGAQSNLCELRTHLEPGQSCDVTIRFVPTGAAGAKSGTLTVNAIAPGLVSKTAALSGTALAAVVYVNASIDMGKILVGDTVTKSFVIGNGGNTPLLLANFARGSTNNRSVPNAPTEFTAAHNCPASLNPGVECIVNITFSPDQNNNWGQVSSKETFGFSSFTNGSWQESFVSLLGEGHGADLTSDTPNIDWGKVETGAVERGDFRTITYTASGAAPVRVTQFNPTGFGLVQSFAGGTCVAGLTLQPGQSCTVLTKIASSFSGYTAGTSYQETSPLMSINGSYFIGSTLEAKKSARVNVEIAAVAPPTVSFRNPSTFLSSEDTVVTLSGTNMRAGITAAIAGRALSVERASNSLVTVTVPAGLPVGPSTVTLKNTDAYAVPATTSLTAIEGVSISSPVAQVFTLTKNTPTSVSSEGLLDEVVLENGNRLALVEIGSTVVLRLLQPNGVVLSQTSAVGTPSTWYLNAIEPISAALSVEGSTVKFASLVSDAHQACLGGFCSAITRTAGVIHGQATLNASSLSNATYGNIAIVGSIASDPSVTGAVAIGSNGSQTVIAYQATLGASYAAIKLFEHGTLRSTNTVSSIVGVRSSVGVALNGSNAFIRHGNKIRTFDTSGSTLSAQAEYVFNTELASDSARGLAYSEGAQALVTSCYAGTVLCLIPAIETALGSAEFLAGSRGVSGYTDGNYLDARLAIESVSKGAADLVLMRQASNPKWLRAAHVGATTNNGVQLTATAVDFGSVNAGGQQAATVTFTNSGTVGAGLLSAPAISGPNSFSITATTCAETLLPGESCSVTVRFAPTSEGLFSGTLSFDTNYGLINATLSGAGVANPAVAVSTAELAFEGVLVSTSSQKTITLTNTGNVALQTFSANLSGTGFSSSHNCPATLNVSASCTVTVTLSPSARVAYSGDITIGYNLATAQVVHLSGQGQAPVLSLSSSTESFGTVAVGGVASKTVTLVNSGNVTANLSYGNLPTTISRFSECGATLAANSSCAVTLTWAPVSAGAVNATLSVSAHQSSVSTSVTGTAVQPYAFSRSPSNLDFGTVQVPNTAIRTLTITNTGANALSGGTFLIKGSESSEYSANADCPASLEPGASCTVSVTLTANRYSTTRSAYLQVVFSETSAQNTNLAATVLAPSLVTGGVKSFGSVAVGSTATASWTLTNNGNLAAPLTFTPASLPSQVARSGGTCNTTLNAGASCTVILKFTPTSSATVTGALPVSSIGTSANMSFIGYGPVVPAIALSPAALNWGTSVALGSSASQSIVLTNTGNIDLTNPSVTITGNLTEYTATSNCPTTLPAGDSCTINVEFAPTGISGTGGTLTAAYAGATSKSASLAGTGQGAMALGFGGSGATLASNDFGAVAVGSNLARSQTFYNSSSNQIATFEWGPLPSYLTRGGTCTTALAVNANCTIILTYRPTSVAQDTASYTFSANGKQFEITNVGRGTTTQQATLTPNALAFGTVNRYSVNTLSTVFKNTGTGPITNPQFAITGLDSFTDDYSLSHDCPVVLAQGDSCNIAVTYSPQNYVGVNAVLSVSYAGTPVISANLTQTLVTPALSVVGSITPRYLNPTATEANTTLTGATLGGSSNTTVTVYNIGNSTASFGISGNLDPQVSVTGGTCLTGTLVAGGNCTVILTFTPTRTGTIDTEFLVSDAYTTLVYKLKGNVTAPSPSFALNKTAISFGGVPAGSSVQELITVTNTGVTHLSTINVAASGYDFAVDSSNCPATLLSGASCTIAVSYLPVKYVASSGSVSVKFNGAPGVSAKTVSLTGSNSSSNLSFNGSFTNPSIVGTVNAGSTAIGGTVNAPAITLYNAAAAGATANFSYGALPAGWSLGAGTCNTGVLAANSTCTVLLKYTASDRVGRSDQFVINAPDRTLTVNLSGYGTVNTSGARSSAVSASALNFGAVPVGAVSPAQSVAFTNTSNFDVSSPSIAVTAGTAADFLMETDCGPSLAAGASCNVSVRFRPTAYGGATSITGTLSLNYATLATKTVSLSGTSAYANLTASGPLPFPATSVGVARTITFGVTNSASPASSTSTTIGLDDSQLPPEVTRTGGTCSDGTVLAINGSCTVTLTYLPTKASVVQGHYLVTSSAGHSTFLSYSGSATQPASVITLSASSLAFGEVPQGTDGGSKSLVVTNTGAVEVSYPSITLEGSTDMRTTHNCPIILAPAESCLVNVSFKPLKQAKNNLTNDYGVLSVFNSKLSVSYFGAATVQASVTGKGTASLLTIYTGSSNVTVPTIQGSISLGTVALGASATGTINIANGYLLNQAWYYGGDTGPITYSDDFPAGVTREGTCGETLNRGANCSVILRLTPTQIGDISGVLKIEGNNSTVYVAYSGTVVAQSASNVSTSAIAFGAKEMGTTTTQSFVVSNTGLSPISNPSVSYTGNYTNYSVSTDCPMTLNPGELCNVNVTFAPRTAATTNLSILVKFNNTAVATVTVSGTPLMTALSTNGSTGKSGTINFPGVVVGATSVATINVYNNASATSPATLQLGELPSTIVRTGGTCGDTLEPGANCNITLTHTPDTLAMTRGKLTISSQFGQSIEYTYSVTPTGAPSFSISSANMAFGSNPRNSTSEQVVTITNSGKLPMTNPSAVISGNVAEYSVTSDCPLTLAVDETCEAVVTFTPTTTTGTAGTLTVGYTGATSRTVALTGQGY